MSANESLESVKLLVDVETDNQNGKITQNLREAMEYLNEQETLFGVSPTIQPTKYQRALIEALAAGIYVHWNKPEHSTKSEELGMSKIRTHVKARSQKQSEEGVAQGSQQFLKTTGNVREGNGL